MKVIFLDVDGVLNNLASLERDGWISIDSECFQRLENICHAVPDVKIVLSSTWRLQDRDRKSINKCLERHGLEMIGCTPDLNVTMRGDEIRAWLNDNKVSKFVILDDNNDFLSEQIPFLIQTSMKTGLTNEHVKMAIEILST